MGPRSTSGDVPRPRSTRRAPPSPGKLDGVAVTADGQVWLATDNDGVDENHGETVFHSLGSLESLGG